MTLPLRNPPRPGPRRKFGLLIKGLLYPYWIVVLPISAEMFTEQMHGDCRRCTLKHPNGKVRRFRTCNEARKAYSTFLWKFREIQQREKATA